MSIGNMYQLSLTLAFCKRDNTSAFNGQTQKLRERAILLREIHKEFETYLKANRLRADQLGYENETLSASPTATASAFASNRPILERLPSISQINRHLIFFIFRKLITSFMIMPQLVGFVPVLFLASAVRARRTFNQEINLTSIDPLIII